MSSKNFFQVLDQDWKPDKSRARHPKGSGKKRGKKPPPRKIPMAVQAQQLRRQKYRYEYRNMPNGNVENNSTLYLITNVAHSHQIESLFNEAIEKAKNMPEVFGEDFECEFQINVVRKYDGHYMGYAFVDVTNPDFYYALIGYNTDGTERAEYIDDPQWHQPQIEEPDQDDEPVFNWGGESSGNWGDESIVEQIEAPKIKKELPPLISLSSYPYEQDQLDHFKEEEGRETTETHGTVSISPAFITPGVGENYDDCKLYVSNVPEKNPDFLYAIFARYARSRSSREKKQYFPKISIQESGFLDPVRENSQGKIFAIVEYATPYDAAFARVMLQKTRAQYNGKDITMTVRPAYRNQH